MNAVARINAMNAAEFVAAFGALYEHSPWAAEQAYAHRPFAGASDIANAFAQAITDAAPDAQLALIRAHPELGPAALARNGLTLESQSEQASAGLSALKGETADELARLNAAYRNRFAFPFIICVRLHTLEQIFAAIRHRADNDRETEIAAALEQINHIARLRLNDALAALDAPA